MKHQYFGNRRDLFKYDLLLDVLAGVPSLKRLTLVPMLTPDDTTREGPRLPASSGRRSPELATFLSRCHQENVRDLRQLREFFRDQGITYEPYRDNEVFDPGRRAEYFDSIPASSLAEALIFLDPDTGLEPSNAKQMRRGGPEKYLLYREVAQLFTRAGSSSAVVVYQHLQRNKRLIAGDIFEKGMGLLRALQVESVGYVTDDDVVFFGAGTSRSVSQAMLDAFLHHGAKHELAAGQLTPEPEDYKPSI
jgi:hypothetical protein